MTPKRGGKRIDGKVVSLAEFRRLWFDPTLTLDDIGAKLGITRQAVRMRASKRGLAPRRSIANEQRATIIDNEFARMWAAKVRFGELVTHYRVSHTAIIKTAARMGLPKRGKNAWDTITMDEYREMKLGEALAASAAHTRAALSDQRRPS